MENDQGHRQAQQPTHSEVGRYVPKGGRQVKEGRQGIEKKRTRRLHKVVPTQQTRQAGGRAEVQRHKGVCRYGEGTCLQNHNV